MPASHKLKSTGLSPETLNALAIPMKYRQLFASTFPHKKEALAKISEFVTDFDPSKATGGLRISGHPNSGKTFLACHVLKLLAYRSGVVGLYVSMPDLIETYFQGAYGEFKRMIKNPPILVIDNVNAPRHEGQKNALLRAMRTRSDEGLPTVLVTCLRDKLFTDCYCVFHARSGERGSEEFFRDDEVSLLCLKNLKLVSTLTD